VEDQADPPPNVRDVMAPDTDPTDEELAAVMRTALDLVRERNAISDAWVASKLEEATRFAHEQRAAWDAEEKGS
jgi:hypothetical protein